ncbi:Integrase zinc binding domain [Popillia japonica]|uniref:Integrase zinc binding domain n=1 Tax=Popillia japonica TaxID=7064 RepID=A0AAW1I7E2_POPJA
MKTSTSGLYVSYYLTIIVGHKMQSEVIRKIYDGQFGVRKAEDILLLDFWIPNVRSKIECRIRNCIRCILAERKHGKQERMLNPIDKADLPL